MSKLIILSDMDKMLMEKGLEPFSLHETNRLLMEISSKQNRSVIEIKLEDVLEYHRSLKKDMFNVKCEEEIVKGFTASNGHTYRLNRDDQTNMIGQKDELGDDPNITELEWKTMDEGMVLHTRDEWLTVYRESFTYKKTLIFKYNKLKDKVDKATTHEEIVKIEWETV